MAITGFEFDPDEIVLTLQTTSTPTTPAAGNGKIFGDSADGLLKYIASSGTIYNLTAGSFPFTTKGDLVAYTGLAPERVGVGTNGQLLVADSSQTAGLNYTGPLESRYGLNVFRISNSVLGIDTGVVTVEGKIIYNDILKSLDLTTAANWIGGSSLESINEWVHVYIDASGNILLYDKHPNYPIADITSRVFTGRVNQAGWNGTSGLGLNASSLIYDDDSGESNIKAGMYLYVYGDSAYEVGRGKGSGAAASNNDLSIARITTIDTGTNTITLDTNGLGHQIAINDNDYIYAAEKGLPLYRQVSGAWYRWLGALWNDGSSNLVAQDNLNGIMNRRNDFASFAANGTSYTTTSTAFVAVDSINFNLDVISLSGMLQIAFTGTFKNDTTDGRIFLDLLINGSIIGGVSGIIGAASVNANNLFILSIDRLISGLPPGTHNCQLQWRVNTGTGSLFTGTVYAIFPQFYMRSIE